MALCPPFSNYYVGYRAYSPSYYQITENSVCCRATLFVFSRKNRIITERRAEEKDPAPIQLPPYRGDIGLGRMRPNHRVPAEFCEHLPFSSTSEGGVP